MENEDKTIKVIVTDVDISFMSMVNLMVKFAFAIIPAAFVVFILFTAGTMILKALTGT